MIDFGRISPGEWIATYPAEIIVCDPQGTILEMSGVAIANYEREGGAALIGRSVFEHHRGDSRTQMENVVHRKRPVIYTTEKGGLKKLVSIAPWYRGDQYAGFTLIVLDLPKVIPNIVKD